VYERDSHGDLDSDSSYHGGDDGGSLQHSHPYPPTAATAAAPTAAAAAVAAVAAAVPTTPRSMERKRRQEEQRVEAAMRSFTVEMEAMSRLRHPNIILFLVGGYGTHCDAMRRDVM
jgi:hypothetical protein